MRKVNLISSIAALLASAPRNADISACLEHSIGYARVEDENGCGYDIAGHSSGEVEVEMFWENGKFWGRWVISPCEDNINYTGFPYGEDDPRPLPSWLVWEDDCGSEPD